jgi:hypothetical protein
MKYILLAGLLGLLVTGLVFGPAIHVRAGSDSDAQLSHPLLQETDYPANTPTTEDYPVDTPTTEGYPAGTPSPQPNGTATLPTNPSALPTASETVTMTPTETATLPPNTFLTEDSEMGGSKVTPPPSETLAPTAVLTAAKGHTPVASMNHSARGVSAEKQNGFRVNWGMFWMGFALPVIAACGVVLYFLDRRPDLFRPKQK